MQLFDTEEGRDFLLQVQVGLPSLIHLALICRPLDTAIWNDVLDAASVASDFAF